MSKVVNVQHESCWMQNHYYEITITTSHGQKRVKCNPGMIKEWLNELDCYIINMTEVRSWREDNATLGQVIKEDYQRPWGELPLEYTVMYYSSNGGRYKCEIEYEDS